MAYDRYLISTAPRAYRNTLEYAKAPARHAMQTKLITARKFALQSLEAKLGSPSGTSKPARASTNGRVIRPPWSLTATMESTAPDYAHHHAQGHLMAHVADPKLQALLAGLEKPVRRWGSRVQGPHRRRWLLPKVGRQPS